MKTLLATAALLLLTACASPYDAALESRVAPRPEAPLNKADGQALAPYQAAAHFKVR